MLKTVGMGKDEYKLNDKGFVDRQNYDLSAYLKCGVILPVLPNCLLQKVCHYILFTNSTNSVLS